MAAERPARAKATRRHQSQSQWTPQRVAPSTPECRPLSGRRTQPQREQSPSREALQSLRCRTHFALATRRSSPVTRRGQYKDLTPVPPARAAVGVLQTGLLLPAECPQQPRSIMPTRAGYARAAAPPAQRRGLARPSYSACLEMVSPSIVCRCATLSSWALDCSFPGGGRSL